MDVLEKLFGSATKVKMMRLFLFNPATPYGLHQITERTQASRRKARRQIGILSRIGMVKPKVFFKEKTVRKNKRSVLKREKIHGWVLNPRFPYLTALQSFLIDITPLKGSQILKKLNRAGRLRLVILSGVFLHDLESRADILVVGDHIKLGILENLMRKFEAEIGRELKYVAFETKDFTYRLGVYDKLIRDILDYRHETLLDRLGVERTRSF